MRIIVLPVCVFLCCAIDLGSAAALNKAPADFLKDPPNFTEAPSPTPSKGIARVHYLLHQIPQSVLPLPQIPMIFPRINRRGNQDCSPDSNPVLVLSNAFLRFSVLPIFRWWNRVSHSHANCPMDRVMAFVARPVITILVSVCRSIVHYCNWSIVINCRLQRNFVEHHRIIKSLLFQLRLLRIKSSKSADSRQSSWTTWRAGLRPWLDLWNVASRICRRSFEARPSLRTI